MVPGNLRRIAVSGARGRIGSALCERLSDLPAVVEGYSTQPGLKNLLDTSSLADPWVIRKIDILIHAGWSTMPLSAEQRPSGVWFDDLPLLAGILDAIRSLPINERPFLVFLSSASVYGRNEDGCDERMTSPNPESWYAFGKLSAERMINEFIRRFDLKCVILRLSNVYGFSNGESVQGIVPRLLQAAIRGGEVEIWGDGRTAKDYLHINDAVSGILKVIESGSVGVYNLSYGRSLLLADLISYVEEVVGKPIRRKYNQACEWDVSQTLIKNEHFSDVFGWKPCVTMHEGIMKCKSELDL